jgi:hypothetical protein
MPSLKGTFGRLYQISEQQGHALAWQGLAIVARAWLLSRVVATLGPKSQAAYFTLLGFLGFQIAFELGFGFLMQTSASHEFAGLQWDGNSLVGPKRQIERLQSLFRLMVRWLCWAAGGMFVVLSSAALFAYRHTLSDAVFDWWLLVTGSVLLQSADLPLQGCVAFLSGLRNPGLQARNVGLSSAGASLLATTWLFYDPSAYCLLFALLGSQLTTTIHLYATQRNVIRELTIPKTTGVAAVDWKTEILPIQWRMAVSSLAGAFYFYFLPASILPAYGPLAAAQFGLTNTLLQAAQSISATIAIAAAPAMATLAAMRSYDRLDKLAMRIWWTSNTVLFAVLILIAFMSTAAIALWIPVLNNRVLSMRMTLLMCLATLATHHSSVIGVYLRSHRYEPMAPIGVLVAFLSALWTTYACRKLDFEWLLFGNCMINVACGFGIASVVVWILRLKRGGGDAET